MIYNLSSDENFCQFKIQQLFCDGYYQAYVLKYQGLMTYEMWEGTV